MAAPGDLTPDELKTIALVNALTDTGNLGPLVGVLQGADGGPERARDALRLLGELDLDLLVQIALDTLANGHLADPSGAEQPRRALRGDDAA